MRKLDLQKKARLSKYSREALIVSNSSSSPYNYFHTRRCQVLKVLIVLLSGSHPIGTQQTSILNASTSLLRGGRAILDLLFDFLSAFNIGPGAILHPSHPGLSKVNATGRWSINLYVYGCVMGVIVIAS